MIVPNTSMKMQKKTKTQSFVVSDELAVVTVKTFYLAMPTILHEVKL